MDEPSPNYFAQMQRMEDDLLEDALIYKATDDLTYNHYAWQRRMYGISAERLAPHYPRADKYEERYQADLKKLDKREAA
jgi:hypothetical protein